MQLIIVKKELITIITIIIHCGGPRPSWSIYTSLRTQFGSSEALQIHHHFQDIFDVTYWITVCTR